MFGKSKYNRIKSTFIHSFDECIKMLCEQSTTKTYFEQNAGFFHFMDSNLRERFQNRCSNYEFDQNQPKSIQLFDLPFSGQSVNLTSEIAGMFGYFVYKLIIFCKFDLSSVLQQFSNSQCIVFIWFCSVLKCSNNG